MIYDVNSPLYQGFLKVNAKRQDEADKKVRKGQNKQVMSKARQLVAVLGAFVEVYLAKEGHEGSVGMNLLTKIQIPNLPSLYGAMLAGVDVILMGAGIPKEIPAALDQLAKHQKASLRFDVDELPAGEDQRLVIDPQEFWTTTPPEIKRPHFLAIIASNSLATMLARKASGKVNGFVIEGPTAGGHNAPPRGETRLNERGEPIYGERDVVDLDKMSELGLPFWLAGGAGRKGRLKEALAAGVAPPVHLEATHAKVLEHLTLEQLMLHAL